MTYASLRRRCGIPVAVLGLAVTLMCATSGPAAARPDHQTSGTGTAATPQYQWPTGEGAGGAAVTWTAPDHRHSSYRHASRWWGGASTRIRIRGPKAPHVYAFHLKLPPHTRLRINRFGEVLARRHGRRIGILGSPWAKNARGHELRTWYTVRGHRVSQHIDFSRHSRFPIKADPWWNPFSWQWSSAFHVAWDEVQSCGTGAAKAVVGLAGGTVAVNVLLMHVAGRVALTLPGGAYAYAGTGVYGCIGSFYD